MATPPERTFYVSESQIQPFYAIKDPRSTIDFAFDWSLWLKPPDLSLGSPTLVSAVWTLSAGLTLESTSLTSKVASILLSGGGLGDNYQVICRVTASAPVGLPRTEERSVNIHVENR